MQKLTKQEALLERQVLIVYEKGKDMEKLSKFRMRIFSTNRNYILSAESSDEMEAWITALQGSLAEHYTHEEMVEKAEAAEIMLPLIKEQTKMQNDLYQQQVRLS